MNVERLRGRDDGGGVRCGVVAVSENTACWRLDARTDQPNRTSRPKRPDGAAVSKFSQPVGGKDRMRYAGS